MSSQWINGDVLEKIHLWNERNYNPEVARPIRSLIGYTFNDVDDSYDDLEEFLYDGGASGFTADPHPDIRNDRTNGIVVAPDSPINPAELAALTIGIMERQASIRAEQSPNNTALPDVIPLSVDQYRWTSDYELRNALVKTGASPTVLQNESLYLKNVNTFYHPEDIDLENNAFLSQRNVSLIQNILNLNTSLFKSEEWTGISIVADVTKVTKFEDKLKVREKSNVVDALHLLIDKMVKKSWIVGPDFSKKNLIVNLRGANNGFNYSYPVLLSGEGLVIDGNIRFDVNLSVSV